MPFQEPTDDRYEQAAMLLPEEIRSAVMNLPQDSQRICEEIRLRSGRPLCLVFPDGEKTISADGRLNVEAMRITRENILDTLENATDRSVHAAMESIRAGFITVRGGHRIGIGGSAVVKNAEVTNIRQPSSLSLRIARQIKGAADEILPELIKDGQFQNTLIVSPPGFGKTTLLRDMIRQLSNGNRSLGFAGLRVSLADERGEVAAQYEAEPQFDIGDHTDVLGGCDKEIALMMLLRAMSPQVLALDEITAQADIKAMSAACNCGVRLLATAHGNDINDLLTRPLYREMRQIGIFRQAVIISMQDNKRNYQRVSLE